MTAARIEVLQWVNRTFASKSTPGFASLSKVPAKAIARLINALFGNHICPLHEIAFDDATPTASLRNRRKVIELVKAAGYDGVVPDPVKWEEGQAFTAELCLWKWIYSQHLKHPLQEGTCDMSLEPAGGGDMSSLMPPSAMQSPPQSVVRKASPSKQCAGWPIKRPRSDEDDREELLTDRLGGPSEGSLSDSGNQFPKRCQETMLIDVLASSDLPEAPVLVTGKYGPTEGRSEHNTTHLAAKRVSGPQTAAASAGAARQQHDDFHPALTSISASVVNAIHEIASESAQATHIASSSTANRFQQPTSSVEECDACRQLAQAIFIAKQASLERMCQLKKRLDQACMERNAELLLAALKEIP